MNAETALPPPPASKGRDPWKIFGIITIVLVVVGGAVAAGFFLGSSDDETAVGTVPPVTTSAPTTTTAPPTTTTAAPATTAAPYINYSTVPPGPMPPPVRPMTWQEELVNKWRLQNPRIAQRARASSEVVYKFGSGYSGLLPGPGSAVDVTQTERDNLASAYNIYVQGYLEFWSESLCERLESTGWKASDFTSSVLVADDFSEEQIVFERDIVFSQCPENF